MSLIYKIIYNILEYECLINDEDQFASSMLDFEDYKFNNNNVNKPILYSTKNDFYIFKFDFFTEINQLDLNIEIANEENMSDQIIKLYISRDNNEYHNVKKAILMFDEKNAKFNLDFGDQICNTLYLKIELKNNFLRGINSVKYTMTKNKIKLLENKNSLHIKNNDKEKLFIESIPINNKEIFVDSAHLSDLGNMELAEKIANVINNPELK